jgi:hypothetical protein
MEARGCKKGMGQPVTGRMYPARDGYACPRDGVYARPGSAGTAIANNTANVVIFNSFWAMEWVF